MVSTCDAQSQYGRTVREGWLKNANKNAKFYLALQRPGGVVRLRLRGSSLGAKVVANRRESVALSLRGRALGGEAGLVRGALLLLRLDFRLRMIG
jgi:hypothetical protein